MSKLQQQTETSSRGNTDHDETIAQSDWFSAMQDRFLKNFYVMSRNNDRLVDLFRPQIRAQQISKVALCGINMTPRQKGSDQQSAMTRPICSVSFSPTLLPSPVADSCAPVVEEEAGESYSALNVELLTEVSLTPMPNFELMNETELNQQLDRFGARPMCKSKAVQLLKKIFEATHPVLSESTPITKKVAHALNYGKPNLQQTKTTEIAREKRMRAAIAKMTANNDQVDKDAAFLEDRFTDEMLSSSVPEISHAKARKDTNDLTRSFLNWLREEGNENLYTELLTLNPIMLDRLLDLFGPELRAQKVSQIAFADMLDKLHITYCVRNNGCYLVSLVTLLPSPVADSCAPVVEEEADESCSTLNFKLLTEVSLTPMPNFEVMDETELNQQLDRFGARPMCKSKAVQLLKKIFEATHPVLSESTPITKKVAHALNYGKPNLQQTKTTEIAREKRMRAAIAKMTANNDQVDKDAAFLEDRFTDEMLSSSVPEISHAKARKDTNDLTRSFLNWLREEGNENLYTELLTLNPIMLDRLLDLFGPQLRAQKVSQIAFADMLDKLHITYCVRNNGG